MKWIFLALACCLFGYYEEYNTYKNICKSFSKYPIKFEYVQLINNNTNTLGVYHKDLKKIQIQWDAKKKKQILYHELGHAATHMINDLNEGSIVKLWYNFNQINVLSYMSCNSTHPTFYTNYDRSFVSPYACTSFVEDVAETYANIMTPFKEWNFVTRRKARALCTLFHDYNIRCDYWNIKN